MYKIRYACLSDAGIMGEIHTKSWKAAYKGIIPDEILDNINTEKSKMFFEKALTEKWEEDALIFQQDKAVGMITIGKCRDKDKDQTYGEIWGIYLHPDYYHKGIGTVLINWGIDELKKRNYKRITLWVLEENISARKFYEKIGFRHDGTVNEINIGKKLNEYRYVIDIR